MDIETTSCAYWDASSVHTANNYCIFNKPLANCQTFVFHSLGFSRIELNPSPLLRIIEREFHGVEEKLLKFQGEGIPKIEEKTWISRGVNAKKWKIPGWSG